MAPRFDAFISYRRGDGAFAAAWLRRRLRAFVFPEQLREFQRDLSIYQDIAYESAAPDFYEKLKGALAATNHLIVLTTAKAMQPAKPDQDDWVEQEIDDFCGANPQPSIIPCIVDGPFPGPLPGRLHERFPRLEMIDLRALRGLRRSSFANRTRLNDEVIKIVARLHGVPVESMPVLREEDARQRARTTARLAALAVLTAAIFLGLAVFAFIKQREAKREEQLATARLDAGVAVAHDVVYTIDEQLDAVSGSIVVREQLLRAADGLLVRLRVGASGNPGAQVEANAHCHRGDLAMRYHEVAKAEAEFQLFSRMANDLLRGDPSSTSYQDDVALAAGRLAAVARRKGLPAESKRLYEQELKGYEALSQADPKDLRLKSNIALVHQSLANLARDEGELSSAEREFQLALQLAQAVVDTDPSRRTRYQASLDAMQTLVGDQQGGADARSQLAVALNGLGDAARNVGKPELAVSYYVRDLAASNQLAAAEEGDTDSQLSLAETECDLGVALLALHRAGDAQSHFSRGLAIVALQRPAASEQVDWLRRAFLCEAWQLRSGEQKPLGSATPAYRSQTSALAKQVEARHLAAGNRDISEALRYLASTASY